MFAKAFLFLLAPIAAYAATQNVDVGNGGLKFTPQSIKAKPGDKVNFHYYPGDHGVAESTFARPCVPKKNGFWSGYIDSNSGVASKMFTLTINDTNPIWIYCPNSNKHCQFGMAMVINQAEGQSLTSYKINAKTTRSKTPPKVQGGKIGPNKGS